MPTEHLAEQSMFRFAKRCCASRYQTAVHEVVDKSLNPVVPLLCPMYVVSVRDLLVMTEVKPMQILQKDGIAIPYAPGMTVVFVSHQWVGTDHPDQDFAQMQVLAYPMRLC